LDEPGFKATWDITLEHPDRSIAVSNFPVLSSTKFVEQGVQRVRTTFTTTYKMSTYLVAWAIVPDDFDSKSITVNGVKVAVHGPKSAIQNNLAEFPLEVAQKVLQYYTSTFGINAAIPPKIDLIGLPGYPQPSSPSWGLNAFHQDNLFYNELLNSVADKQMVAEMIAKEFAHYWFGNYVTCQWWDDLWLNEALAIFYQYKSIHSIYPDWGVVGIFYIYLTFFSLNKKIW
jgi:aminopeptidase N